MSLWRRLRRKIISQPVSYPQQFSVQMDLPCANETSSIWLIASTPRSGSHFLGHMFKDTGEAGVPLEYLRPRNLEQWRRRFGKLSDKDLFQEILRHRTTRNGVFCIKAHWHQFEPFREEVGSLFGQAKIEKVVFLLRKDQVAQAISYSIAAQTGVYMAGAKATGTARYKYEDIIFRAESVLAENRAWVNWLSEHKKISSMTTLYEDIVIGHSERKRIQAFLGLERELIPARSIKNKAHRFQRIGKSVSWGI